MGAKTRRDPGAVFLEALAKGAGPLRFPLYGRSVVATDWTTHLRSLPLHLLYFVTQHRMLASVDGHQFELRAGSLLWLGPELAHHLWQPAGEPRFGVYFMRFDAGKVQGMGRRPPCLLVHNAWELRPTMQQLLEELRSPRPFTEAVVRGLLLQLLGRAKRRQERGAAEEPLLTPLQHERLDQLLETRGGQRVRPAEMAAVLGLSPDYFTRLFRRSVGLSPKIWLVQQRMRAAASQLADTTGSIKEIAHGLGYGDLYLFSRQFKGVMGVSPREFRRGR